MATRGKNGSVKGGSWPGSYVCKYPENWYYKGKVRCVEDEEFFIQLSDIGKKLYSAAFEAAKCESIETALELDNFIGLMINLQSVSLEYCNFIEKNKAKVYSINPSLLHASYNVIQLIGSVKISTLPYRFAVIYEIEQRLRFFKYFMVEGKFIAGRDNHGARIDLCTLHYESITEIGPFI